MIQIIIKYGRPIVLAIKKSGSTPPPVVSWIWGILTGKSWGTSTPDKLWGVPESTTAPTNLSAPAITGPAIVGQTLTINGGTWNAVPYILKYDIYRGATLLTSLATSNSSISYTVLQSDVNGNINCVVSAINSAGTAVAPTSNTVTIVDTIMDSQTNVYNAWSMVRLLRGAYYGSPIIRLRRTNDNVESDFGIGANGLLDESAVTTWTGANSATLVTLYAQDGSTRHFTNATPSTQPTFVNAGVIVKRTGVGSGAIARPAADFNGTQSLTVNASTALYNFIHNGNNAWIYGIAEFGKIANPNNGYGFVGNSAFSGGNRGITLAYDDRGAVPRDNTFVQLINPAAVSNVSANGYILPQRLYLLTSQVDADNVTASNRGGFAINAEAVIRNNTSTVAPSALDASFNLQLGTCGNNVLPLVGYISEVIIFNADKTSADASIKNNINAIYSTYTPVIVSDPDAQAFVDAASITSQSQANTVNTLVIGMKAQGLWTKMKAVYPMVGGAEYSHKFNLKDPRDLNAAFRLAFSAGWTHSNTGVLPNGTSAFADTFLVCSTEFNTTTFNHFSYYSRSNTAKAAEYVMGSFDGVGNTGMIIRRNDNSSLMIADYPSSTTFRAATGSVTDSRGFFLGSQTGANIKMFKNNLLLASNTGTTLNSAQSTRSVYIGALNSTPASFYTDKECAFASIGQGLSDTEITNYNTLVQAFQTALGRNV